MWRAAASPYRKIEDEGPHFGVCLHGPFLVSFSQAHRVEQVVPSGSNAAIIHCEAAPRSALLDKFSERIQTGRAVADALSEGLGALPWH